MLTASELERYERQIPLIGKDGQERLKASKVFIAGAGGLGCPAAAYLAVAGIGHLTIVDSDAVERTNLNRQILHWEKDIGCSKVSSAGEKLRQMNPAVQVNLIRDTITGENASSLVAGSDLIIDALDNFTDRYMINRAALEHRIPYIHGAVSGFDGHIAVIIPGETACLECLVPETPNQSVVPILGAVSGIIGILQAHEAIKLITGKGEGIRRHFMLWEGSKSTLTSFKAERDPDCPACGDIEAGAGNCGEIE
jgi:molybdopterin/thiamine biosynthesis adenylyltransferase